MLDDARTLEHLERGKSSIIGSFWDSRNITSVGISTRVRAGERTDQPAVRVGVVKKRKPAQVRSDEMLPSTIDIDGTTYAVDVVEVGEAIAYNFPPDWTFTEIERPLRPGIQIGNPGNTIAGGGWFYGTLGCFVRDNGRVAIMSNAHVLVDWASNTAKDITQPTPIDDGTGHPSNVVATLERIVHYNGSVLARNIADVSTAVLNNASAGTYTEDPVGQLMPAPSPQHKAVGLFFAGNPHCSAGWICKIHNCLSALGPGVEMLTPGSALVAGEYRYQDKIEKVGARSGYSSTRIDDISATLKMTTEDGRKINFVDCIGTGRMGWPGDSGSLVCLGGTGYDWVPLDNPNGECTILGAVGAMYDLPVSSEVAYADRIRDEFLSLTELGSLLIDLFYLNADTVTSRSAQSPTNDYEKAGARSLYDKYYGFVKGVLDNPRDPSNVVKQEHLDDTAQAINGAALHMTTEESQALADIYNQVIKKTLGMNYDQILAYMNDRAVYDYVLNRLKTVPTIVTQGVIRG
ncbi:hypothetical protein [Amycolatopsis sp. DG1A-15b]|uniref:hypothetical protein n=1 Tax=Amycolatopsis sp. DG1A-15b TaxID=3052846 RepID=UPI00255B6F9E|nr:hypothetical protein [Amycolatopsis sp. DG1A-15b]WIX91326.1 hypothetical protein QRY02_13090 [Amycolatopsis sp. DG1A-15b]